MASMTYVTDLGHSLLRPFVDLMRPGNGTPTEHFIAEGRILIETLAHGGISFQSIVVSESHRSLLETELSFVRTAAWIVVPAALVHEIAGFQFHGGMLAIGMRPKAMTLSELASQASKRSFGIVACASLRNQDNLGLIVRSARAFGINAVLLSDDSGDPWSRRGLRVSMGASLLMPVIGSADLVADLGFLRDQGFILFGAQVSARSRPFHGVVVSEKFVLVLGNESAGLSPEIQGICQVQVQIPMVANHDSLNVAVAGGILMQYFTSTALRSH